MPPILIAGPPRSGTSMISALLIKHDVWIGDARGTMYPSTNTDIGTENLYIKNIMKRQSRYLGYTNWNAPLPTSKSIEEHCDWTGAKEDIESIVPEGQRWLVKTSWLLVFHDFWRKAYPEALWVFPYRSPASIMDSMNRHPKMRKHSDEQKAAFIAALHKKQETVKKLVRRSIVVYPKKIASLDMKETRKFFDFCCIRMDEGVVRDFIQPEMMH